MSTVTLSVGKQSSTNVNPTIHPDDWTTPIQLRLNSEVGPTQSEKTRDCHEVDMILRRSACKPIDWRIRAAPVPNWAHGVPLPYRNANKVKIICPPPILIIIRSFAKNFKYIYEKVIVEFDDGSYCCLCRGTRHRTVYVVKAGDHHPRRVVVIR